jgi:hypothetical protein
LGVGNSTTYRLPNSRKSNFATEPSGELVVHRHLLAQTICSHRGSVARVQDTREAWHHRHNCGERRTFVRSARGAHGLEARPVHPGSMQRARGNLWRARACRPTPCSSVPPLALPAPLSLSRLASIMATARRVCPPAHPPRVCHRAWEYSRPVVEPDPGGLGSVKDATPPPQHCTHHVYT